MRVKENEHYTLLTRAWYIQQHNNRKLSRKDFQSHLSAVEVRIDTGHLYPRDAASDSNTVHCNSLPHQLVLQTQKDVKTFASDVISGDDADNLLRTLVYRLDRGIPEGWERLMRTPDARGSSGFNIIVTKDLDRTVDKWELDPRIREQVYQDVRILIELHAQEAIFVSQEFRYNVPACTQGELPVCMTTVVVVVRRLLASADDDSDIVELRHIYVKTVANAIQQFQTVYGEDCHSCWFHRCCHPTATQIPRSISSDESNAIQAVLSTKSMWWANENMPTGTIVSVLSQCLPLSVQLRQFVDSNTENEDVFKEYDDVLLDTLQGSIQSTQQRTRSLSLSIKEQNLPMVGNLISNCLKKADIEQSLQEMWEQAQQDSPGMPFSLECQNVKQHRIVEDPPSVGCNKSAVVSINTQYSWVLLSPQPNSIECVFIGSDVTADHLECETVPEIPDDPIPMPSPNSNCHQVMDLELPGEGSLARLSVPNEDGSFSSVRYLAQWSAYTQQLNKAMMDIVRYAGAHAFLRIPVPHPKEPLNSLVNNLAPFEFNSTALGESMLAIGNGMSAIGEGWNKLSNAIGPHYSENVRRVVCLGFKHYEHTVKALAAHAIPQYRFEDVVDSLIKVARVKNEDVEELREVMIILELSDDVTWKGQTVSYTSDDGLHRFFHFYKYLNQTTNTVDIAFGSLAADFTIAPDTMIIEKKKVGWFGLKHEETTEYRDVPHTLTYNDTVLLNTYFEVVAYRHMAGVLNLPVPEYPSTGGICTIS
ncbi:hypothetical protein BGX28_009537 [Mortierella sp. GBA30]|nr:hypothetical protein BGX28_009537 [Mortierella sp. GBA30]